MDPIPYSDDYLRGILERTRVIAMVGASTNIRRPSYYAYKYLREKGFRVIPVNARAAGGTLLGETVMPDLETIDVPVDMVDIFRRSEYVAPLVDEAIQAGAKYVWMQDGVEDEAAARKAQDAGLLVVMNN